MSHNGDVAVSLLIVGVVFEEMSFCGRYRAMAVLGGICGEVFIE